MTLFDFMDQHPYMTIFIVVFLGTTISNVFSRKE